MLYIVGYGKYFAPTKLSPMFSVDISLIFTHTFHHNQCSRFEYMKVEYIKYTFGQFKIDCQACWNVDGDVFTIYFNKYMWILTIAY